MSTGPHVSPHNILGINTLHGDMVVIVILTWNMLSSPLPLPLEEPPGFELSPLFGFLAGFSGALGFFLFA